LLSKGKCKVTPQHPAAGKEGDWRYSAPHCYLTPTWGCMVKDTLQALYTPGKNHGTQCRGDCRDSRVGLEGDGDPQKNRWPRRGSNPDRPAHSESFAGPQTVMWVCQNLVYKKTQAASEMSYRVMLSESCTQVHIFNYVAELSSTIYRISLTTEWIHQFLQGNRRNRMV